MPNLNIAGYRFVTLSNLPEIKLTLNALCEEQSLKGTILLSEEGININLAGLPEAISVFKNFLEQDARFHGMSFHESFSDSQPFRFLRIKLKKEIITFRQAEVKTTEKRAPEIQPEELKQWLDEKREFTLLDTRNEFEISMGTFDNAVNLHLSHFSELPEATPSLDKDKPVVMFCTGGIRCEKAAIYLQQQGFAEVYQLDGGILGYFSKVGAAHYTGECFVFDDRISVTAENFK